MYTYNDQYYTPSASTDVSAGFLLLLGLFYFVFIIVMYVVMAIFLGKIFKKAGVPAWIAWVPFYNSWKMLEIGGQPGYWAVLAIIPLVNIASAVFMWIAMYHIGKKLGKEDAFVLLAIFLAPVWIIWLGADHSVWDESKGAPRRDTPVTTPPTTTPTPADIPAATDSNPADVPPPPAQVEAEQKDDNDETPPSQPQTPNATLK